MSEYTERHARSGLSAALPELESFPNQFPGYEAEIEIPEFTSICPRTGLPDFGTIRIRYMPGRSCVELKSLKLYVNGYRNVGIFQENAVNRMMRDFVKAVRPVWVRVTGEFKARGGISTVVECRHPPLKGKGPR